MTGVVVQSGPKQMMSCALARLRSEPPISTPAPIDALSVIGFVIVPAAVTVTASGPSSVSSVWLSADPVSTRASVTVPPSEMEPELIVAWSSPSETVALTDVIDALTARSMWPSLRRNGVLAGAVMSTPSARSRPIVARAVKTGGCAPGVVVSESSEMPIASRRSPKSSGTEVETQPGPVVQLASVPGASTAVR